MTNSEKYLKNFGKLESWQEDIVKKSLGYQSALLKDSLVNLGKEFLKSIRGVAKRLNAPDCRSGDHGFESRHHDQHQ